MGKESQERHQGMAAASPCHPVTVGGTISTVQSYKPVFGHTVPIPGLQTTHMIPDCFYATSLLLLTRVSTRQTCIPTGLGTDSCDYWFSFLFQNSRVQIQS
jgi:hypothetical protein